MLFILSVSVFVSVFNASEMIFERDDRKRSSASQFNHSSQLELTRIPISNLIIVFVLETLYMM